MIVDCAHYRAGRRQQAEQLDVEEAASRVKGGDDFVWLGLHDPGEDELARVAKAFGLHELAVEDARHAHQRPKLEEYDGSFFLVLRSARYIDETEEVEFGEIHIFAGPGYAIVVRRGAASELTSARRRLEERHELLQMGPVAVVWAILDQVVDNYAPVVAGIDNDIEEVEAAIFQERIDSTERIYFLKREVIEFNRAVSPLLIPLEALERGGYVRIDDQLQRFFRDVADHARRVHDRLMSQRELLTSILEANLALVGVRQNEVIRGISAWAAIIAVPTFLASIWGMNFGDMPELDEPWGYPLALALMATAVLALFRFFRRIEWL